MSKQNAKKAKHDPTVANDIPVSRGTIKKDVQITVKDTGWSEAEKERMKQCGYDSLDMVRAWYN